jgi:hypothetical protein
MISVYAIALVITEAIPYAVIMWILARTYHASKYPAHLYLMIGFTLNLGMAVIRFTTSAIGDQMGGFISILWSMMNLMFILGIFFVFFAFIFARYNKIHPITIIVALIFGFASCLVMLPEFRTLVYDASVGAWSSDYSFVLLLSIIPAMVICTISFVLPILFKIRAFRGKKVKKGPLFAQATGLVVVFIWAGMIVFTGNSLIRNVRPFLFPLSIFIWSFTLAIDPLNVMVSSARLSDLVITNKCGLLVFDYDFKHKKETADELVSALLSGVLGALEYISSRTYDDKTTLSSVIYKDKVIGVVNEGFLFAFVIGEQLDMALTVVLHSLLRDLQAEPRYSDAITPTHIALSTENKVAISEKVQNMLDRILVVSTPISRGENDENTN